MRGRRPFADTPSFFPPASSLHLFTVHGIIANRTYYMWRSDREAEGARLLSEYAPKGHLGFESLLLRHRINSPRNRGGFSCQRNLQGIRTVEVEFRPVGQERSSGAFLGIRPTELAREGCGFAKRIRESLLLRHRIYSPRNCGGFFIVGKLAGDSYFLNLNHLNPETLSGFLR